MVEIGTAKTNIYELTRLILKDCKVGPGQRLNINSAPVQCAIQQVKGILHTIQVGALLRLCPIWDQVFKHGALEEDIAEELGINLDDFYKELEK
jgi:hypothetical protein